MSYSFCRIFFAALLLLFLSSQAAYSEEPEYIIKFGYPSGENSAVIFNKYSSLLNLLSEKLGKKVLFVPKKTYREMLTGFLSNEIEMGILNAYSFIYLMDSPDLIPIAARVKENSKNYSTYFIARKDSSIRNITDMKNKIFAFGDPYSTSSFLVPMYQLDMFNIKPEKYFSNTVIIPKQDSIIYSILNKTVDGGAVASFIFNEQKEELKSKFRIIHETRQYPLGPFVVNTRIGESNIEKTREFLLNIGNTEEGRSALLKAGLDPFTDVQKSDYSWLKKIAEAGYSIDAEETTDLDSLRP